MDRFAHVIVLSTMLSGAPFQCSTEPDPSVALEDRPGEALYELAGEFKKKGDDAAWRQTLGYLIERYPASRFAETAKRDLEATPAEGGPEGAKSKRTAASPK